MKRKKKSLIYAAGIILVLAAVALVLFFIHRWENREQLSQSPDEEPEQAEFYYNGSWYTQREDLDTFLLIGVDKYSDELAETLKLGQELGENINTQQSDFLVLLALDRKANTCTVLPLNRDTMTEIQILGLAGEPQSSFDGQLALAHTYGSGGTDSGQNTVKAVSTLLYGVEIDHFIAVTMDAVPKLNDLVGGVTVLVEDDFSNVTDQLPQGETVKLTGNLALTYIRARSGVGEQTNISRMERQKNYLLAFYQALRTHVQEQENFSFNMVMQISPYLVSDCTANQLAELCQLTADSDLTVLNPPEGKSVKGEKYMEFYPDEEKLQQLVVSVFFEPAARDGEG